jgi:hypothetical protein
MISDLIASIYPIDKKSNSWESAFKTFSVGQQAKLTNLDISAIILRLEQKIVLFFNNWNEYDQTIYLLAKY